MKPGMDASIRRYEHLTDFDRVGQFLIDTYRPGNQHDNWLQPRWEYMLYHPSFDATLQAVFSNTGVWESDGAIVAVAHFELRPGEVFFQVHPEFTHLKLEMLEYAEIHLSAEAGDGKRNIAVWINDFDVSFESIVRKRG
jgi:hypothetical protein